MKPRLSSTGRIRLCNGRLLLTAAGAAAPTPGLVTLGAASDFDKDMRTYQHRGGSKAVPFSVSFTGDAPATLQARTVDAASGAEIVPWATVPVTVNAGVASGSLSVAKGTQTHKLQLRSTSDLANVLTVAKAFRVGEVVLLIGQSNMAAFPKNTSKYPLGGPLNMEYRGGAFLRVGNVLDSYAPNTLSGAGGYGGGYTTPSRQGDGMTYLGNLLVDGLGCAICFIECAVGGTSIDKWMTGGSCWDSATDGVDVVHLVAEAGGDFGTVIWYQGEQDVSMSSAIYRNKLSLLLGQCQILSQRDQSSLKFGVVSLGPVSLSSPYSGSSSAKFGQMRAAQVEWAYSTPGAFYVGGMHDTHTNDGVHVVGEGYNRAGRRWAKSVLAAYGVGASGAGPRIAGATRSGSTVTLAITHSGGTALLDGAGGNGSALTGFEFKDAGGNVLAYSASSIASATTLQFTVTGTPTTVSYAMMNAPHQADPTVSTTAPVLASCVYDNATYLNGVAAPFGLSTVGSPLQPCGPIAITGG